MVRHAKSSWKHDVNDHQRPLKSRGERDGELVSKKIKNTIVPPQKIFSSNAERAMATAKYFKEALNVADENFSTTADLYDFSGQGVMRIIKELNNDWDTVMIVGHNHAFTSLANMLGSKFIDNIPTCGFVMIEFDEKKWNDITTGKTVNTLFPRDIK